MTKFQDSVETKKFILPIRREGALTPLFLIHPVGGTVFAYAPFISHVKDRPIYGIQDPSVVLQEKLFNSIEEMASCYIRGIKTIQKEGPYYLGGASFGATVAFEAARQLLENGDEIAMIAAFDGWAFYPEKLRNKEDFEALMDSLPEMVRLKEFYAKTGTSANQWVDLQWHRMELINSYTMPTVNTNVTLFKAQDLLPEFAAQENSLNHWGRYCDVPEPMDAYLVAGDHYTMFRQPHVNELGKVLQEHLEKLGRAEPLQEDIEEACLA